MPLPRPADDTAMRIDVAVFVGSLRPARFIVDRHILIQGNLVVLLRPATAVMESSTSLRYGGRGGGVEKRRLGSEDGVV